jgi:hypothetical protein
MAAPASAPGIGATAHHDLPEGKPSSSPRVPTTFHQLLAAVGHPFTLQAVP